jgi:hypothetical protein
MTLIRDLADKTAKMRRAVRANNFTQQTNALDVDKHMCVTLFLPPLLERGGLISVQVGVYRGKHEAPSWAHRAVERHWRGRNARRSRRERESGPFQGPAV